MQILLVTGFFLFILIAFTLLLSPLYFIIFLIHYSKTYLFYFIEKIKGDDEFVREFKKEYFLNNDQDSELGLELTKIKNKHQLFLFKQKLEIATQIKLLKTILYSDEYLSLKAEESRLKTLQLMIFKEQDRKEVDEEIRALKLKMQPFKKIELEILKLKNIF